MTDEQAMQLVRGNLLVRFDLSPGLEDLNNRRLVRLAKEAYELGFKAGIKEAATKTEET